MKKLFVELLINVIRCITYALRILEGAHAPHAPSKSASGQVIVLKQIDDMGKPTVQIIVNCKLGIVLNVNSL